MRQRKIRILHEGREYWLVDSGGRGPARVLTFLRPRREGEELRADQAVVATDLGDCVTVASWADGALAVGEGHEDLRGVLEGLVERYLEEHRVGRARQGAPPCYFLSREREPLFDLHPAHPGGLAVLVFTSRERAAEAARTRTVLDGPEVKVERCGDLAGFLLSRAEEGFAGALEDERDPIYPFADEVGQLRFLRFSVDPATGRLAHHLLDEKGEWTDYEGEEELTPEADQDEFDRCMTERLGDSPYLGFREGGLVYRPVAANKPDELVSIDDADDEVLGGQPYVPVFHDLDLARAFLDEHGLGDAELAPIDDLPAFAERATREGRVIVLQPGGHRARSATIWSNEGRLLLDSFSGVWASGDGKTFEKT